LEGIFVKTFTDATLLHSLDMFTALIVDSAERISKGCVGSAEGGGDGVQQTCTTAACCTHLGNKQQVVLAVARGSTVVLACNVEDEDAPLLSGDALFTLSVA
jgi:deoxycytidylate deaminase